MLTITLSLAHTLAHTRTLIRTHSQNSLACSVTIGDVFSFGVILWELMTGIDPFTIITITPSTPNAASVKSVYTTPPFLTNRYHKVRSTGNQPNDPLDENLVEDMEVREIVRVAMLTEAAYRPTFDELTRSITTVLAITQGILLYSPPPRNRQLLEGIVALPLEV